MKKKGKRRICPFCRIKFIPEARTQYSQQYCCRSDECKRESHKASARKYREKHRNDEIWKKKENNRVKKWQQEHPGYWKDKKSKKIIFLDAFLRDMSQAQKVTSFPVLRDMTVYLYACLSGYIAYSTDWDDNLVLRDFIASRMNRFYDKGIALSSGRNINSFKEEDYNDPQRNRKTGTSETPARGIWLG